MWLILAILVVAVGWLATQRRRQVEEFVDKMMTKGRVALPALHSTSKSAFWAERDVKRITWDKGTNPVDQVVCSRRAYTSQEGYDMASLVNILRRLQLKVANELGGGDERYFQWSYLIDTEEDVSGSYRNNVKQLAELPEKVATSQVHALALLYEGHYWVVITDKRDPEKDVMWHFDGTGDFFDKKSFGLRVEGEAGRPVTVGWDVVAEKYADSGVGQGKPRGVERPHNTHAFQRGSFMCGFHALDAVLNVLNHGNPYASDYRSTGDKSGAQQLPVAFKWK